MKEHLSVEGTRDRQIRNKKDNKIQNNRSSHDHPKQWLIGFSMNLKIIVYLHKGPCNSLQFFNCIFYQDADTHSFSNIHSISDAKFYNSTQK